MNMAAILSALDDHGFGDTDPVRKVEIVNDVVGDICSREAWPFLEASASCAIASDGTVTLPADFRAALAFIIPSIGMVLTPERLDTVTKTYLTQAATGIPYIYYFIGSAMKVWPTGQTSTATLMYVRNHADLTSSSPEADILIPKRHHRVIVLGALVRLYAMEDDPELGAVFNQQYEARIGVMEGDLWKRQYDRPDRVVDLWNDDWSL